MMRVGLFLVCLVLFLVGGALVFAEADGAEGPISRAVFVGTAWMMASLIAAAILVAR